MRNQLFMNDMKFVADLQHWVLAATCQMLQSATLGFKGLIQNTFKSTEQQMINKPIA